MSTELETIQISNCRRRTSLWLGICFFFAEGVNYAQHGPFFPLEAKSKNSSVSWVGVISGSYDVISLICSFVFPFLVSPQKSHLYFILGSFLVAACGFSFGFTNFIENTLVFNLVCLTIRSVMGIGGALIWQNGIPLLVSLSPKNTSMIPGLIEASLAMGFILGPAFGSLMYSVGGYSLPFISAGAFHLCMTILGFLFIQNPHHILEKNQFDKNTESSAMDGIRKLGSENEKTEKITAVSKVDQTFSRFLSNPSMFTATLPYMLCCSFHAYFWVFLAPYLLETYSIGGDKNGFYFLAYSLGIAVSCPLVGKLTSHGYGGLLYTLAPFFAFIGFFLWFLSKYLSIFNTPYLLLLLLFSLGCSYSLSIVTVFLVCEKLAIQTGFTDLGLVKTYVASWRMIIFSGGRITGFIIIGGFILNNIGFYWTTLLQSLLLLGAGVLYTGIFTLELNKLLRHKMFYHVENPTCTNFNENNNTLKSDDV